MRRIEASFLPEDRRDEAHRGLLPPWVREGVRVNVGYASLGERRSEG